MFKNYDKAILGNQLLLILYLHILAYKKLLQIAWTYNSVDYEMKWYDGLSLQYYYKSDIKKWYFYSQKVDNGDGEQKNKYVL